MFDVLMLLNVLNVFNVCDLLFILPPARKPPERFDVLMFDVLMFDVLMLLNVLNVFNVCACCI
jgi:hypothetical protein